MNHQDLSAKLQKEPLFLAKVIVSNNPQQVAINLSGVGINVPEESSAADILDIFFDALPELSDKQIYQVLNVPYNHLEPNNTQGYLSVLQVTQQELADQSSYDVLDLPKWAETYADSVYKIRDAYYDFTGKPSSKSLNDANHANPSNCLGCQNGYKSFTEIALIIGGGVLALVLIITLSSKNG